MSSALIDFGPGERHIFKWVGKKCYYVPELFHMSPTTQSNQPIKLFINDIQQSKSLIQIYGGIGYDKQRQNYIMVNNYPIRHVSIFGKLISCNEKTREDKKKKKKDDYNNNKSNTFYICRIDDSSGRHLMMDCVINESVFMDFDPQLTFFGRSPVMLQLSGKITYQFGNKELIVDRVELLCRNQNLMLSTELEQCKHYFTQRERLISPWVYTPPEDRICITIDDDDDIDSDNSDDIGIQRFNYINVKSLDEITCHFINWILSNDKLKFKLLDLYSDPLLSQLIENQTVHDPNKPTKSEVFHSIRRHIQIDCKLILITKSQNVYCSDLFKVVKFIADELEKAKEQNSELELSEIQGGILGILRDESTLNILYVNEIIKWLVKFEENEWKYIDERETWVYDADEQNPLVQEDTLEDILIKETFEEHEELTLDDIIIEDSIIILD